MRTFYLHEKIDGVGPNRAEAMLKFLQAEDDTPTIKTNSTGGSIFEGLSTLEAVVDRNVNTHNIFLAASMAAYILVSGARRTANKGSQIMLHRGSSSGGNQQLINDTNSRLRQILEVKTNLPESHLNRMFENGEDMWYNTDQALVYSLIDEVVGENVAPNEIELVSLPTEKRLSAALEIAASIDNPSKKQKKRMDAQIYQLLDLNADASDVSVAEAIKSMGAKAEGYKKDVETLTAELNAARQDAKQATTEKAELQEKLKGFEAKEAKEMVAQAVKDGKVSEANKSVWEERAVSDKEGTKALLDTLVGSNPANPIDNGIQAGGGGVDVNTLTAEMVTEDTYASLTKSQLQSIMKEDENLYKKIIEKKQ